MSLNRIARTTALLCLLLPALASAAIVQSNAFSTVSEIDYPCSAADLINASQPTLAASTDVNYTAFSGSSTAKLNDGGLGIPSDVTTVAFDLDGTWETTYYLNTSVNTYGYTLTNITTLAGWPGPRASQRFELLLSFQGDPVPGFTSYGIFQLIDGRTGSSKIELTGASGVIASNVSAVRFSFLGPAGSEPTYREVDVFGVPSIAAFPVVTPLPITGGTGPGGVGTTGDTLKLWLRADVLTMADGATVTNWPDSSGNGFAAGPGPGAGNDPAFYGAVLNGRPAVRFDGNDWLRRTNAALTARDIFTVARYSAGPTFSEYNGILGLDPADSVANYFLNGMKADTRLSPGATTGFGLARRNGTNIAATAAVQGGLGHDFGPITNFWIGTFQALSAISAPSYAVGAIYATPDRCWNGDICELATFSPGLNTVQRALVENYASAKYGIPLVAGEDRYAGDDPAKGDYDADVFGIGRIDGGNLYVNSGSAGLGLQCVALTNGEWILAGHKMPTNTITNGQWSRVWYIDSTGMAGTETVTLSFGWGDAGLGAAQHTFRTLAYSATDGGSMQPLVRNGTYSNDVVTFTLLASQLPDGYYTLMAPPVIPGVLMRAQ